MPVSVGSGRHRLLELLAAAAHGALAAHQFPNPRAQRGQALGQGVAWGGQNFKTAEALVAWINAHGGNTNAQQFRHNHPLAFMPIGQAHGFGGGPVAPRSDPVLVGPPAPAPPPGGGTDYIGPPVGAPPPSATPPPPPIRIPPFGPATVPLLAALVAHHLSSPKQRVRRRPRALSY